MNISGTTKAETAQRNGLVDAAEGAIVNTLPNIVRILKGINFLMSKRITKDTGKAISVRSDINIMNVCSELQRKNLKPWSKCRRMAVQFARSLLNLMISTRSILITAMKPEKFGVFFAESATEELGISITASNF